MLITLDSSVRNFIFFMLHFTSHKTNKSSPDKNQVSVSFPYGLCVLQVM